MSGPPRFQVRTNFRKWQLFRVINAATMWRLSGDRKKSEKLAAEVVRRANLQAHRKRSKRFVAMRFPWGAHLLLDDHEESLRWFLKAVLLANVRGDMGSLVSMQNNLQHLAAVGATATFDFLYEHLGKVVVFCGYMINSPER